VPTTIDDLGKWIPEMKEMDGWKNDITEIEKFE
jgi:adenylosuccinate synthase